MPAFIRRRNLCATIVTTTAGAMPCSTTAAEALLGFATVAERAADIGRPHESGDRAGAGGAQLRRTARDLGRRAGAARLSRLRRPGRAHRRRLPPPRQSAERRGG